FGYKHKCSNNDSNKNYKNDRGNNAVTGEYREDGTPTGKADTAVDGCPGNRAWDLRDGEFPPLDTNQACRGKHCRLQADGEIAQWHGDYADLMNEGSPGLCSIAIEPGFNLGPFTIVFFFRAHMRCCAGGASSYPVGPLAAQGTEDIHEYPGSPEWEVRQHFIHTALAPTSFTRNHSKYI